MVVCRHAPSGFAGPPSIRVEPFGLSSVEHAQVALCGHRRRLRAPSHADDRHRANVRDVPVDKHLPIAGPGAAEGVGERRRVATSAASAAVSASARARISNPGVESGGSRRTRHAQRSNVPDRGRTISGCRADRSGVSRHGRASTIRPIGSVDCAKGFVHGFRSFSTVRVHGCGWMPVIAVRVRRASARLGGRVLCWGPEIPICKGQVSRVGFLRGFSSARSSSSGATTHS
jgi:hypothetical protein